LLRANPYEAPTEPAVRVAGSASRRRRYTSARGAADLADFYEWTTIASVSLPIWPAGLD
jgi:hypothetical protein